MLTERRIDDTATAPTCAGCRCFRAAVADVPTDDGPAALCWLCRHAVVEHGVPVARAWDSDVKHHDDGSIRHVAYGTGRVCLCWHRVYPADVLAAREAGRAEHRARMAALLVAAVPSAEQPVPAALTPEQVERAQRLASWRRSALTRTRLALRSAENTVARRRRQIAAIERTGGGLLQAAGI